MRGVAAGVAPLWIGVLQLLFAGALWPLPTALLAIGGAWAVVTPALLAVAAALFHDPGAPPPRSR